jgi:hypothetical protein
MGSVPKRSILSPFQADNNFDVNNARSLEWGFNGRDISVHISVCFHLGMALCRISNDNTRYTCDLSQNAISQVWSFDIDNQPIRSCGCMAKTIAFFVLLAAHIVARRERHSGNNPLLQFFIFMTDPPEEETKL